jgi:teichuronic acid exporter
MNLRNKAISGVKWTFVQQLSVQSVNFIVQIILARLLMPEEFGLLAMVVVVVAIGQTLTDSGMTSSLIRIKNPTDLDYSTVFITNLVISVFIYSIVYLIAPIIAQFYKQDILVSVIRILAISFVVRAIFAVHIAKLTKEMNFKLIMTLQLPSSLLAGIVAVFLAYEGYGVWSLVWLSLLQAILSAILNWSFIGWRPQFIFSKECFRNHFTFGYKLTISGLLNTLYDNSYRIIIGKYYSAATVGFYNLAETMRLFPVHQINVVVGKVTYPLFASINNDDVRLKAVYKVSMKLVLLIVIPLMLTLILLAEEGFRLIFGEHWLPAVPLFQILALASIIRPISSFNLNILKIKGRSDLFLKLEIVKKTLGILAIIIGLYFGLTGLVIASVMHFTVTVLIDVYYSGNLISYSIKEQLGDFKNLFYIGAFVLIIVFILKTYTENYLKYDFLILFSYSTAFFLLFFPIVFFFDRQLWATLKNLKVKS